MIATLESRIEACIQRIEASGDAVATESARELVDALLEMHGRGLGRIVELLRAELDAPLLEKLAADGDVAPLLLLYGLHPRPLETRVRDALAVVKPKLASHGGDVELVGIVGNRVRLKLTGACQGCPSSSATLSGLVEAAVLEAAPDSDGVELA